MSIGFEFLEGLGLGSRGLGLERLGPRYVSVPEKVPYLLSILGMHAFGATAWGISDSFSSSFDSEP